jgi:hypothetical protein
MQITLTACVSFFGQKSLPGLDAVKSHSKLMVLGKPISGKTIFLKPIVIPCDRAKFEANKIQTFIVLKTFSEIANLDLLADIKQNSKIAQNHTTRGTPLTIAYRKIEPSGTPPENFEFPQGSTLASDKR